MTINHAKEILTEFYKAAKQTDLDPSIPLEKLDGIIEDYAHKIIEKGQWE